MEEHDFLQGICLIALSADKKVEFVGIVDGNGKLFVGKYRQYVEKSFLIKSSLFFSAFIIPALKLCKRRTRKISMGPKTEVDYSNNDDSHIDFKIIGLNNIRLAITPLTKINERYLCVFIDTSASCQEIISKIRDNI